MDNNEARIFVAATTRPTPTQTDCLVHDDLSVLTFNLLIKSERLMTLLS